MNYFNTIYRENLWKNDESISGDGSTLKCSYPYLSFLNEFTSDKLVLTFSTIKSWDLKYIYVNSVIFSYK